MNHALLSIHAVAGIVFVGGSPVAASLLPRCAPLAGAAEPGEHNPAVAALPHGVTGGYAPVGVVIPTIVRPRSVAA